MPLELTLDALKSIPVGSSRLTSDRRRMAEAKRTGAVVSPAVEHRPREGSGFVVDWQLPAQADEVRPGRRD
jgi:hypothetical protein